MKFRSIINLIKKIWLNIHNSDNASPIEVEFSERAFYLDYVRPGMTVFDVGANIGELTLLFSRFAGKSGQVHAFEPSENTFQCLMTICDIAARYRSLENITCNRVALADKSGELKFNVYDEGHSGWNTLAQRPLGVKPNTIQEVPATTVDLYCEKEGISYIDLLKIDVEGAEYQVLLGARRMLEKQQIGCCVFEFGQATFDMGNEPSEIEVFLEDLGYKISNVVKGDPVFPPRTPGRGSYFTVQVAMPKKARAKLWFTKRFLR